MVGDVIRLGILGPGGIVERMHRDFHRVPGMRITAVGSRSLQRAQQAAQKYGATHAFGSYEELAACPDVDLIYIATPHNFHMQHAMLCMRNGKHVLCEKPMALNEHEVLRMIECAREHDVFLMEAMWTRLFPATLRLRELLQEGAIGPVVHVRSDFCFRAEPDEGRRLFCRALAGGALLDVGIYTMAATSLVLGCEPSAVSGTCHKQFGVDVMADVSLRYPGGETAHQLMGFRAASAHDLVIMGEKGRIHVPDFWHPTRILLTPNGQATQEYTFEPEEEGFRHEFGHVRDCLLRGERQSSAMPLHETLALSRISTQLRREWGVIYPEEEA